MKYELNQKKNIVIADFPDFPVPYKVKDWRRAALDIDGFIYNWQPDLKGRDYPTIFVDKTYNTFKIPSYYGDERIDTDGSQDSLSTIGSVVSASLLGIDKSNQHGYDYVDKVRAFFKNHGIVDANVGVNTNETFWYSLLSNVLYLQLSDLYPWKQNLYDDTRDIADNIYNMVVALGGHQASFFHQGYNFLTMMPSDDRWKEPDAAGMAALILYWSYKRFGDEKYLKAAMWSLDFLERIEYNPLYEVGIDSAIYAASRINAETGSNYSIDKYFKWKTERVSDSRIDFGMVSSNWHGFDMHGSLAGTGYNGYAFGMEAWFGAGQIVPMVRYDPRYAEMVGKYMLHLSNNSRFFFPHEWDERHQSYPKYRFAPENVLPYEGLKKDYRGIPMYACGDPSELRELWRLGPNCTDLSIYSAAFVGILGAIVSVTNIPYILKLDVTATDFFKSDGYPTYLFYNPYDEVKEVEMELESDSDLFDIITGEFIRRNTVGNISIAISPGSPSVIVIAPGGSDLVIDGSLIKLNGHFAAYLPSNK